jgi:diguanylate cyclase (GGDEF)-like protein
VLDSVREDPSRVHAVAYLDLDQFKVVNDSCGHAAGDELLRQLAARLHERLRKRDTIARLGGDEFGLLLEDCPPEQAMRIATSLVQTVADYRFNWQGKVFSLGVSIGLVVIDGTAGSAASVMSAADAACYQAKERGRNRVHAWHPDDAELSRRQGEAQWVERLRGAIENNRLQIDAQPIVPLAASTPGVTPRRRLELLMRVVDEQGGIVPPGAFIPAAERFRLMPQFDRWMVRRALQWLAAEQTAAGSASALPICSINLSGTSMADDTLLAYIREQFHSSGVPATCVCFEIAESVAVANLPQVTHMISELRAMGCSFALDDFGSGMSSFAYLKHLRVDFLKIDGSFVRDMVDDPIDCAMVEAINRIGQVMGIRTIAEHAEDERIVQRLREMGVDYAQGTGIVAPQPLASLSTLAPPAN